MFRISALLILVLTVASNGAAQAPQVDPVEAQRRADAEAARAAAQRKAEADQMRRQREEVDRKMREFLNDLPGAREKTQIEKDAEQRRRKVAREEELRRLNVALQGFKFARQELSEALKLKTKLRDPAKKMEKNTGIFLSLIQRKNKVRPSLDPSEFKGLSNVELGTQMLSIAETVTVGLAAVIATEKEDTVDVRFLSSLPALEQDLLRLRWIAGQLK